MLVRLALCVAAAVAATALLCAPAMARSGKPAPNTGRPGSPCKPQPFDGPDPGPAADVDTTSLGKAAPASYEIGMPTSAPAPGEPPRRVMMFVHGGAWTTVGRKAMRTEREVATKWRAAGWETVSVSYRGCRRSIRDVVRFYDLIRARVGPSVPICLRGQSAGGHLALMVAAKRPDVACVISLAAPTDLRSVKPQGRIEAASGTAPARVRAGSARVRNLAVAAFGKRRLRAISPVTYARRIAARLLLATAMNDVVVPQGQATELARAVTSARAGCLRRCGATRRRADRVRARLCQRPGDARLRRARRPARRAVRQGPGRCGTAAQAAPGQPARRHPERHPRVVRPRPLTFSGDRDPDLARRNRLVALRS